MNQLIKLKQKQFEYICLLYSDQYYKINSHLKYYLALYSNYIPLKILFF